MHQCTNNLQLKTFDLFTPTKRKTISNMKNIITKNVQIYIDTRHYTRSIYFIIA